MAWPHAAGGFSVDKTVGSSFDAHYAQLRLLARAHLAREQVRVSTGTLAHTLYLQMQAGEHLQFASREHFLKYASRAMRTLLVDMARRRKADKRGGEFEAVSLSQAEDVADLGAGTPERILVLNQALERLGRSQPRLLAVAEMRAFLDLDFAAIGQALELSESQVKRDWQRAKAFLIDLLETSH
jgi:RNA polymerase sigma factor (TIGR02999 family)